MRQPVFGLDIDGTLGEYHSHFIRFASGWLGRQLEEKYDGSVPLHSWIGTSKGTYRQIKLAYRMGGLKRSMPALPWASQLTHEISRWGAQVYICTTRPYLAHDNIDADTRHWLRRERIRCKGVVWGEHKYRELARMVGKENVVAVLDDLPEMLAQAASLGIPAVMAVRPHNVVYPLRVSVGQLDEGPDLWGAETYEETRDVLRGLLEEWRAKK